MECALCLPTDMHRYNAYTYIPVSLGKGAIGAFRGPVPSPLHVGIIAFNGGRGCFHSGDRLGDYLCARGRSHWRWEIFRATAYFLALEAGVFF